MNEPVVDNNRVRKACKKAVSFFNTWFIKTIIRPIFFVIPPSLITLIATENDL